MTEIVYCEHSDLRKHGLPPGVLAQQALPIASVDATANTLGIADHACAESDPVIFTVDPGGVLPAPLVAGTTYYAKLVTNRPDLLQVSATVGAGAVNLTDVGSGSFGMLADVSASQSLEARRYASRQVDSYMPAESVPFPADAIPPQIIAYTAKLAGRELMRERGRKDAGVWEMADAVLADLSNARRYGLGIRTSTTSSMAATGTRWGDDARSWREPDGSLP